MIAYKVIYSIHTADGEHRLTHVVKTKSERDAEKKTVKFVKEYMDRMATILGTEKIKW